MNRSALIVTAIFAVLLLLLSAGYLGSYYAMLDDIAIHLDGQNSIKILPAYHGGGVFVDSIFWPAHQLDRLIRPSHWESEAWLPLSD